VVISDEDTGLKLSKNDITVACEINNCIINSKREKKRRKRNRKREQESDERKLISGHI